MDREARQEATRLGTLRPGRQVPPACCLKTPLFIPRNRHRAGSGPRTIPGEPAAARLAGAYDQNRCIVDWARTGGPDLHAPGGL